MIELVMCPPYYLSTKIANNVWMQDIPEDKRRVNLDLALKQWFDVYQLFSSQAIVWLMPPDRELQDMTYTANVGAALPHLDKTVIASNFRAEGRSGEEQYFISLAEQLGYDVYLCPYYFEGEAELKHLYDNLYIGGYGIRSEEKALDWISRSFDAKIIKVKLSDPYLYHLDCVVFPLSANYVIASDVIPSSSLEAISKVSNVITVSRDLAYAGICNSVRLGFTVYNANNIAAYEVGSSDYQMEVSKNIKLEEICRNLGLGLYFVELTEMLKSGALLSCLVMHLRREVVYL